MVLGDADPVEAKLVGRGGVAKPALEALLRDIRIAGVRQGAGPVSAGASVMSATQERSFHARDSTVPEKQCAQGIRQLTAPGCWFKARRRSSLDRGVELLSGRMLLSFIGTPRAHCATTR